MSFSEEQEGRGGRDWKKEEVQKNRERGGGGRHLARATSRYFLRTQW